MKEKKYGSEAQKILLTGSQKNKIQSKEESADKITGRIHN